MGWSLCLSLLCFGVLPVAAATAAASPAGVLIPGSAWLQGQGVDVMGNGGNPATQWQCVELPQARLYPKFGWPRVFAAGNSGAAYIPEGSPGLTRYNPGSGYVPVPGDLVIENPTASNQYGHVAVVDYTSGNTIYAVEQNGSATGRHNYSFNNSSYAGGFGTIKAIMHAPLNNFTNPGAGTGDGTFVRVNETGEVYRIAGGAPVYVSTWNAFGGAQPVTAVSAAQLAAMLVYPRDGTFLNGAQSGTVYRVAGGAPEAVSTWNSFGGVQPTITVDQTAIDNAGGGGAWSHLRGLPLDGTFVSNVADGRVYRIAGGAPLYVSTWDAFGGSQPTTALDPYEFSAYKHLRPYPVDMFLRGTSTGRIFHVSWGGHPLYVSSWDPFGGPQPYVDVDDWALNQCDHLVCDPFGDFNALSGVAGGAVATGWAVDPNSTSAETVHFYSDGVFNRSDVASVSRPDVDAALHFGSSFGYSTTLQLPLGTHSVCAYAINVGSGTTNTQLGCKTVSVTIPPAPQPVLTDVQKYITHVYSDLFNRVPDPGGLATWTNALNSGTPRVAVANAITYSAEYRSGLIQEAYRHYLARDAEPAGLASWLDAMNRGLTIQQMEGGFIASAEYYNQSGDNDAQWVTRLYSDVLGRPAGVAEVNYWVSQLHAPGGGRYAVSMGFLLSTEHLTTVVNGYYLQLLSRNIDPSGQVSWVGAIQHGARVESIIGGIVASPEYYARN